MSFIDWGVTAQPVQNITEEPERAQKSALAGYEIGQKMAALRALQKVDVNDPDTVTGGIQGSIHAGALDQASALLNLSLARQTMSALPQVFAKLSALGASPASPQAQAQAPAAAAPSSTPAPDAVPATAPQPADQTAHAAETMHMASGAVDQLLALPQDQRAAAFAQIKPTFLQRGLPEDAVDAVGSDLSDAHLGQLKEYYAQHATALGQAAAGQPVTAPTAEHPQSAYGWAQNVMNDPNLIASLSMLKARGIDLTGIVDRAQALAMPEVQQQAEEAHAGAIAEAKVPAALIQKAAESAIQAGYETVQVPEQAADGTPTGRMTTVTKTRFLAPRSSGGYGGQATALSPEEQAAQTTRGTTSETMTTIKGPNNEDIHGNWEVRNGQHVFVEARMAGDAGGGSTRGPSSADVASLTDRGNQAATLLKPDPVARSQAADTIANSQRALSIIGAMKFDQTTPIKVQIANALRSAGFPSAAIEQYASDAAGYQSLTNAALAGGAHQAFPSRTTDKDLGLMKTVFPSLTTPNEQAATAFGMQAAQALRTQQMEDFKANYHGDKSDPGAVQRGWLAGPGGQSIFQSPIWANVPVGGRPAFNPATDVKTVKGVKWGAWGLGTGHPVYFQVR